MKGLYMRLCWPRRTLARTIFLFLTIAGLPTFAATPVTLEFVTHALFFSEETHQSHPLDPQVFVKDTRVPAATGPQNIYHAAGYRPAFLNQAASTPLFSATGQPLNFTLGQWLGTKGEVTITPLASGEARIMAHFTGLLPNGVYSLFENHFDQQPIGFTPLDGTGKRNSFHANADGAAIVTVIAPEMLTHANAVLLVYHSDHKAHGTSRGEIGVNAHHQLIARLP